MDCSDGKASADSEVDAEEEEAPQREAGAVGTRGLAVRGVPNNSRFCACRSACADEVGKLGKWLEDNAALFPLALAPPTRTLAGRGVDEGAGVPSAGNAFDDEGGGAAAPQDECPAFARTRCKDPALCAAEPGTREDAARKDGNWSGVRAGALDDAARATLSHTRALPDAALFRDRTECEF